MTHENSNYHRNALQRVIESKRREHEKIDSIAFNNFVERSTIHGIMSDFNDMWTDLTNIDGSGIVQSNQPLRHTPNPIPFDSNPVDYWMREINRLENMIRYCKMNLKQAKKK